MTIAINTNNTALTSLNNLSTLRQNQERITSQRAAGDTSQLNISSRLSVGTDNRALSQQNLNNSISLVQTAEGALNETTSILQGMRELAVMEAHGTPSLEGEKSRATEYNELLEEINRVAQNTSFNGQKLIDGSGYITTSQPDSSDTITISIGNMSASGLGLSKVSADGSDFSTAQAQTAVAITKVEAQRSVLVKAQLRFENTIDGFASATNVEAARGRIEDADYAAETAALAKAQILSQAGTAMLAQANQIPQSVLSLLG